MHDDPSQSCPSDALLDAYAIDAARHPDLRGHVEQCAKCTELVRQARANHQFLAINARFIRRGSAAMRTSHAGETRIPEQSPFAAVSAPAGGVSNVLVQGYVITCEINRGSQGVVLRAIQDATHRDVAIKLLRAEFVPDEMHRRRFEREVELVGGLRHPNIVTVYEGGTTEQGHHYLVMEYVNGVTLAAWREAFTTAALAGSRSARSAAIRALLGMFVRIADGVSHAHLQGVIHRDLKPANIMVDDSAEPRILDFGLAKLVRQRAPKTATVDESTVLLMPNVTSLRGFVGTLVYAAPEQMPGRAQEVDTRTDVYALGVILYELLTGQLPHPAARTMLDFFTSVCETAAPDPLKLNNAVNADLNAIVKKALTKDKTQRYASAAALAADIRHYLAGDAIDARRGSRGYVLRNTLWRARVPLMIAAIFAAVFVASLASKLRDRETIIRQQQAAETAQVTKNWEQHLTRILSARAMAGAGGTSLAENALWREFLAPPPRPPIESADPLDDLSIGGITRQTGDLDAYWALWELYAQQPCRATIAIGAGQLDAICFTQDDSTLVVSSTAAIRQVPSAAELPSTGASVVPEQRQSSLHAVYSHDHEQVLLRSALGRNGWPMAPHPFLPRCALAEYGSPLVCMIDFDAAPPPARWLALPANLRVASLAFGPECDRIAASTIDGHVWLHDATSGTTRLIRKCPVGGSMVKRLAISPDGSQLACGLFSGHVEVWDLRRESRLWRSPDDYADGGINALHYDATGRLLATHDVEGYTCIRDAVSGELLSPPHSSGSSSLMDGRFSPDGDTLAIAGGGARAIDIINTSTGQRTRRLLGHLDEVTSVAFSHSGGLLASGGRDQLLKLWDGRALACARWLRGHTRGINSLSFDPSGSTLASASSDHTVRLWNVATGVEIHPPLNHATRVTAVRFDPLSQYLVSAGGDGCICFWSIADYEQFAEVQAYSQPVLGVTILPDGRLVSCDSRQVSVHNAPPNARTGVVTGSLAVDCNHVAASPDGLTVALLGPSLTDVRATKESMVLRFWRLDTGAVEVLEQPHDGSVRCISYQPSGRMFATGGNDCFAMLWDAATRKRIGKLAGHIQPVTSVRFSPNGAYLATGARHGQIRLWHVASQRCLLTLQAHASDVRAMTFSPDGCTLATADDDGNLALWDLTYFDAHIAGNLAYQRARLQAE